MAQYDPYIRYIKPCADPWVDYKMAQYYPYIYISIQVIWLVVSTPLKNMKVSWDYEIANIWKNMEK